MASRTRDQRSNRRVSEKNGGSMSGFTNRGKKKPAQFTERTPGQREPGFKQRSAKQVTAAMQGTSMPSGKLTNPGTGPARRDATRQFGTPAGKKPF